MRDPKTVERNPDFSPIPLKFSVKNHVEVIIVFPGVEPCKAKTWKLFPKN